MDKKNLIIKLMTLLFVIVISAVLGYKFGNLLIR